MYTAGNNNKINYELTQDLYWIFFCLLAFSIKDKKKKTSKFEKFIRANKVGFGRVTSQM
jgi:hypothetical protein